MPTVSYQGEEIECEEGAILRDVLKEAGLSVYNGRAEQFNCRGTGSCGTCAVQVDGAVSEEGKKEKARLWLPPHHPSHDVRLACQTRVEGDVEVRKGRGLWGGQHLNARSGVGRSRRSSPPATPIGGDDARRYDKNPRRM